MHLYVITAFNINLITQRLLQEETTFYISYIIKYIGETYYMSSSILVCLYFLTRPNFDDPVQKTFVFGPQVQ